MARERFRLVLLGPTYMYVTPLILSSALQSGANLRSTPVLLRFLIRLFSTDCCMNCLSPVTSLDYFGLSCTQAKLPNHGRTQHRVLQRQALHKEYSSWYDRVSTTIKKTADFRGKQTTGIRAIVNTSKVYPTRITRPVLVENNGVEYTWKREDTSGQHHMQHTKGGQRHVVIPALLTLTFQHATSLYTSAVSI